MNKIILSILLLLSVKINAQFKVLSNGDCKIGNQNVVPNGGKLLITDSGRPLELKVFNETRDSAILWALNKSYSYGFGIDRDGFGAIWKNINEQHGEKIMEFNPFGYFGIGVAADNTYRLKVKGTLYADNLAIYNSSTNSRNSQNVYNKSVENLNSISAILYKEQEGDENNTVPSHYRFNVEDILKYYPELVYRNDEEIGVDYFSFIPLLVEKIKEQSEIISTMQIELLNIRCLYEELCEFKANDSHCLNVFPNPFKNHAVIEYSLPDGSNFATLSLVDVSGQNILNWTIDKNKGRIRINETLNHGIYVCYLNCDGNIVDAIILRKTQ